MKRRRFFRAIAAVAAAPAALLAVPRAIEAAPEFSNFLNPEPLREMARRRALRVAEMRANPPLILTEDGRLLIFQFDTEQRVFSWADVERGLA